MNTPRLVSLCIAAGLLLAAPRAVRAQPSNQPAPGPAPRHGLMIGFGVGGGHMSCENTTDEDICDGVTEAGGGEFHIGTVLRPALALNGEIWVMGHTEDYVTITQAITTVGVTFWLMPRLWVRGGVGGAVAKWHYKGPLGLNLSDSTESVPAVMGAVGFEVHAKRTFAIDIQLRGGTGFYKEGDAKAHNVAFNVGFTWY